MLKWGTSVRKKGRKGTSYNTGIPSRVKEEVVKYAYSNWTQAAINHLKSKHPQCTFLRTSSTIGNISLINRKKICYHRSSIKEGDLISYEVTC